MFVLFFVFKQKTAYEMRISDWSSDVCSSDLRIVLFLRIIGQNFSCLDKRIECISLVIGTEVVSRGIKAALKLVRFGGFRVSRSEVRRVGKECVSTCRSRWSPYH